MLPNPFNQLDEKACNAKTLEKSDYLFRQNNKPLAIFYLAKGSIQLERHTSNGDKVIIHRAFMGQTFAEASLFSERYHCDAVAIESVHVISLNKRAILEKMNTDINFAKRLTAHFAAQVQSYRHLIEMRTIRPAIERVYSSVAAGMLTGDIMSFATAIGLSHEATYRALADLVKRGRLKKSGRGRYQIN